MHDAATVDHQHTCPKATPKAHTGGPVAEGSPDVEVNGKRSARVTDRTRCTGVGQNDLILKGSDSVEINGLPAARKADPTTHGGEIVEGSSDVEIGGAAVRASVQQLAQQVLKNPHIHFANAHVSGVRDQAMARDNIASAARGEQLDRSHYGTAPGGSVDADRDALTGMNDLGKDYDYRVSEFAGGSHEAGSRHYAGIAFDVDQINGARATSANGAIPSFWDAGGQLGATQRLGPAFAGHVANDGHGTHVHFGWPRP